jgi:hypothetical protein
LISEETLQSLEKIEQALPQVRDLTASDGELDEIAKLAIDQFKNLNELGMQVDSRFSSEIFQAASSVLGHAITARTAKINKKLKMVDLQLKKAELDRKIAIQEAKEPQKQTQLGEAKVIDRNELLREIMRQAQDAKITKKDK